MTDSENASPAMVRLSVATPHVRRFEEEPLYGIAMGDGRYRLHSTPFLTTEYARGDLVACDESGDGPPRVEGVVMPGGHSTLHILFAHALEEPKLDELVDQLSGYGGVAIEANQRYYTVDVGHDGNERAIVAQCQFWEKRAMAQFATENDTTAKISMALLDEPLVPWTFQHSPVTPVITVKQIVEDFGVIRHAVAPTKDGPWQFLGWETPTEEDARVVKMKDLVDRDPGLVELGNLPSGWHAWRENAGSAWERGKME